MSRFLRLQASLVLFLAWESSCHKRNVAVPLPPAPAAVQPAQSATVPPSAPAPAPTSATPRASAPATSKAPAAPATQAEEPSRYQVNKPPQTTPAKKPAHSAPTPATAPAPVPAAAAVAPQTPPPKLGDVLTADEQKQYSAAIDQSLSRAQASLGSIGGRKLNDDQLAQLDQIRNFMQQAQSMRNSDPSGAKSLAERAEVLARDLAASFR